MLEEYLESEDLDPSTGLPPRQVLEELDLAQFVD
jgi:hypothetical protein